MWGEKILCTNSVTFKNLINSTQKADFIISISVHPKHSLFFLMPKLSTVSVMRTCLSLVLLLFITNTVMAQHANTGDTAVAVKQLPKEGVVLDKGWKFMAGDNP